MSRIRRIFTTLAILLLCSLCSYGGYMIYRLSAAQAAIPTVSAKEAFAVAEKTVKQEYPDAHLKYDWTGSVKTSGRPTPQQMRTQNLSQQVYGGKARRWEFLFCSPERRRSIEVKVEGHTATIEETNPAQPVKFPLEKWQLDSTEAFEKALGALTEEQKRKMPVPLEMKLREPTGKILEVTTDPCWGVWFYPRNLSGRTGIVTVDVNASTGEIVRIWETREEYRTF